MLQLQVFMKLIYQVIFSAILGLIIGLNIDPELTKILKPLGGVYINLLKTIALPLIFFSLISGMTTLSSPKFLYKIGLKSVGLFLLTGLIASLIGIFSSFVFSSTQTNLAMENDKTAVFSPTSFSFESFLELIIPKNLLDAFINDSTIQVTILAILIATAIFTLPSKQKRTLITMANSFNALFLSIMQKIQLLAPFAVFFFITHLTAHFEKKIFHMLFYFVMTLFFAYLVQYIFLGLYIRFISKLPILPFFIKSLEYQSIALSTGSSKATLPSTIKIANKKLGISNERASFILPLGASINMEGLAIYLVLSVLFVAKTAGIFFGLQDYLLLAFLAPLMAIGTAGIPGGAIAILPLFFSIWVLPFEYISLFIAIDPLINMFRSALNITGDVANTLILDQLQGDLKIETYKNMESL